MPTCTSIDVIFVDEPDAHHQSTIGIKGIGEIGIVGVAAVIANAIYHATERPRAATCRSRSINCCDLETTQVAG